MMKRGFTLIETVVYIALLGLIMGGCLAAVWGIVQGMGQVSSRGIDLNEGGFVARKLEWALSGASSASIGGSGCDGTLHVAKYDGTTADFRRNALGSSVEMQEGGAGYLPITTANASTTCLKFQS